MGKAVDIVLLFVEVKNTDVTQERAEMQHECSIIRRIVESKMSDLRVSNKSDDGFENKAVMVNIHVPHNSSVLQNIEHNARNTLPTVSTTNTAKGQQCLAQQNLRVIPSRTEPMGCNCEVGVQSLAAPDISCKTDLADCRLSVRGQLRVR